MEAFAADYKDVTPVVTEPSSERAVESERSAGKTGREFLRSHAGAALACLLATSCGPYPRDIDGTYDRVVERGELRVGLGAMPAMEKELAERYAARVAQATGARLSILPSENSTEALIGRLDEGAIDLVVTDIATDSPWATEVSVIEPLAVRVSGSRAIGLSALAKNGENRWIGVLEREVREMRVRR